MAENEDDGFEEVARVVDSLPTKFKEVRVQLSTTKKQLKNTLEENARLLATINSLKKKPCVKCAKLIDCTEMLKKKLKEKDDTISVIGKLFINHNPESYALASQMVNDVITSSNGDNTIFDSSASLYPEIDSLTKPCISPTSPAKEEGSGPPKKDGSPIVVKHSRNNKRKFLSISSTKRNKPSYGGGGAGAGGVGGDPLTNISESMFLNDDDVNETNLLADGKPPTKMVLETCAPDNVVAVAMHRTPPPPPPPLNPLASPEILSSSLRCNRSLSGDDGANEDRDDDDDDDDDDHRHLNDETQERAGGFPKSRRSLDMKFANADSAGNRRRSPPEAKRKAPSAAETMKPNEDKASSRRIEPMDLEIAKAIQPLPAVPGGVDGNVDETNVAAAAVADKLPAAKTVWNLKKSRELTNRKLKQTVLATAAAQKKVDISTSNEYAGGSIQSSSNAKNTNACKFSSKENGVVDETFFEPAITSTHNDDYEEDANAVHATNPAATTAAAAASAALAELTNKPRPSTVATTPSKAVKIDHDSFDCLPSTSPKYKYKRDAVRKKSERMKLPGQECEKCLDFYSSTKLGTTNSQMRKLLNKCSRHRDKNPIQVYTPPGLWNPFFDDTDEEVDSK